MAMRLQRNFAADNKNNTISVSIRTAHLGVASKCFDRNLYDVINLYELWFIYAKEKGKACI